MNSVKEKDFRSREEKKAAVAHDGVERTTLSFYRYVKIADPAALRRELLQRWGELGCLGRIYVAHEGINAQMNVPSKYFDRFDAYMKSKPEFAGIPYKFAVEEGEAPSFYKLTIKVRPKIVADGLDDNSFDVTNTGAYLSAREFNEYVNDPEAIIVDMRNSYESEVGHFENAITPDVETFRDELKNTPELLKIHKNKKIALYCTGGIRCEKASAWLKHNGFENVRHLKGGIIDYKHQIEREGLPNKFKGKNFVFDERLGERISGEIISTCHLCQKAKSDTHYHCTFEPCHVLYLGCDACVEKLGGYCSYSCMALDKLPPSIKKRYARYYNKFLRPQQFKKCKLKK
ncbi:rhodanese-related sulfurtransferase [Candidatus Kaiserbacteria bacterium]|nr:rhodanese-related sulfurtransferase [Candidatus Kaiserbacteria bacterium]